MNADLIKHLANLYGSPVDPRPRDLHINCPFGSYHSRGMDTSQGLSVQIAPGKVSGAYCFSCGAQGSVESVFTAALVIDTSLTDVVAFIREHDGASLAGALRSIKGPALLEETPVDDWASYSRRCARQVPAYLIERGLVKRDVVRWMLGYDEQLSRAVFPVKDERDNIVGCLRRSVIPQEHRPRSEPTYKDTPGAFVWKKTVFYGENLVDRTYDTAYLVEGPMDAIFTARVFPNALGMMGASTEVGPERLEKLQRWGIRKLVLLLDPDAAGHKAAYGGITAQGKAYRGIRDKLRRQFAISVASLPPGEDPASVTVDTLRQAVAAATYLEAKRPLTGGPRGPNLTPGAKPTTTPRSLQGYLLSKKDSSK